MVIVDRRVNIPQLDINHLKTLIVSKDIEKILHTSFIEFLLQGDNMSILIVLKKPAKWFHVCHSSGVWFQDDGHSVSGNCGIYPLQDARVKGGPLFILDIWGICRWRLVFRDMDVEELDPGTILVFLHLKNNMNMVLNASNNESMMKLRFENCRWRKKVCRLDGIMTWRNCVFVLGVVVTEFKLRYHVRKRSERTEDMRGTKQMKTQIKLACVMLSAWRGWSCCCVCDDVWENATAD